MALKHLLEKQMVRKDSFRVCAVHGDFGSENIFYNGTSFFLIDWERFHLAGPLLTDLLGFWLGQHHKEIFHSPENSFQLFVNDFVDSNNFDITDSLMALAFFCAARFNVAETIASHCPTVI